MEHEASLSLEAPTVRCERCVCMCVYKVCVCKVCMWLVYCRISELAFASLVWVVALT